MEAKQLYMVAVVLLAVLCALASAMSLPEELKHNNVQIDTDKADLDEDRRATWLDTRELEDDFKELVFLAFQELANEGRISSSLIQKSAKTKRGRWQGFCFRRTKSGRFLPYICWKGDRK